MPRPTMATLISKVRKLVNDPASPGQVFTDDEIQDALDHNAKSMTQRPMSNLPTKAVGGAVEYKNYQSSSMWEGGAAVTLQDSAYATIAAADYTEDAILGIWVLDNSTTPPVYITGRTYDLYGAAAEVLGEWLAKLKLEYSFSSDGTSVARHASQLSEKYRQTEALMKGYQLRMRPKSVPNVRDDFEV